MLPAVCSNYERKRKQPSGTLRTLQRRQPPGTFAGMHPAVARLMEGAKMPAGCCCTRLKPRLSLSQLDLLLVQMISAQLEQSISHNDSIASISLVVAFVLG